jgi:hypothetical protein
MAPASDPDLLVLTCLRLKSLAPAETVARLTGLSLDGVSERLEAFTGKGWARYREGVLSGWSLTPAGRVEGAGRAADELAATGTRPAVEAAYGMFLTQNQPFLQVCTDWQLRRSAAGLPAVLNDHTDIDYDRGVIAELRAIDGSARLVCADLARALARFGHYGERFGTALRHVEAGETDWFTRPVLDSYHTIWFELHEDLLTTLGLERSGPDRGDPTDRPSGGQPKNRPSGGERTDRPSGGERTNRERLA